MNTDYYNRELMDEKLNQIHDAIKGVDAKVDILDTRAKYTNGKVRLHEKILLVVGAVTLTLLIVNASPFVTFLDTLIK